MNDEHTLVVSYGDQGVFLNGKDGGKPVDSIYEPAVATIAGCLLWSEILRRSGAYQPVELPKVSVSVNVRVNENSLYTKAETLDFKILDHEVFSSIRNTDDGSMHRRVLLRLGDEDPLVRYLVERLRVEAHSNSFVAQHPEVSFHLPAPRSSLSGHVTLVGAGGLGTWCLHTLVEGLRATDQNDVRFLIFDKDLKEEHNLNRQVIYSEEDVGKTKIEATRRWLRQRLPNAHVETVFELVEPMAHDVTENSTDGLDLDDLLEEQGAEAGVVVEVLTTNQTIDRLKSTDIILGCLDAMRPRVLANYIAAKHNVPYVNGGVANFSGEYSYFNTHSLVTKYGPEIANDMAVMSCQEDGAVPTSSMVLTNALVGAFQALAVIQRLQGTSVPSVDSVYWNAHENRLMIHASDQSNEDPEHVVRLSSALWPMGAVDE